MARHVSSACEFPVHRAMGARIIKKPISAEILRLVETDRRSSQPSDNVLRSLAANAQLGTLERAGIALTRLVGHFGPAEFHITAKLKHAFLVQQRASADTDPPWQRFADVAGDRSVAAARVLSGTSYTSAPWHQFRAAGNILTMAGIALLNQGDELALRDFCAAGKAFMHAGNAFCVLFPNHPAFHEQLSALIAANATAEERMADAAWDNRLLLGTFETTRTTPLDLYSLALKTLGHALTTLAAQPFRRYTHVVFDAGSGFSEEIPNPVLFALDAAITRVGQKVNHLGAAHIWTNWLNATPQYAELQHALAWPPPAIQPYVHHQV